jgi:hypothetical protein
MRVRTVSDSYMPVRYFEEAFAGVADAHALAFSKLRSIRSTGPFPRSGSCGSSRDRRSTLSHGWAASRYSSCREHR